MNPVKSLLGAVVALLLLALLGVGCYWLLHWFVHLFAGKGTLFGLDADLFTALLFAVFAIGSAVRWAVSSGGGAAIRAARIEAYGRAAALWAEAGDDATPRDMRGLEATLGLCASARVLKQYRALRAAPPAERPAALHALLLAMRRDLGLPTVGVEESLD